MKWRGYAGKWLHLVSPSVCPSVNRIVSVFSTIPARSISCLDTHLINQVQNVCSLLRFFFFFFQISKFEYLQNVFSSWLCTSCSIWHLTLTCLTPCTRYSQDQFFSPSGEYPRLMCSQPDLFILWVQSLVYTCYIYCCNCLPAWELIMLIVIKYFYTPVWKTGRIMPWQCPSVRLSVRPSVRPSAFSGLFFNMLWDINLKLGICIQ